MLNFLIAFLSLDIIRKHFDVRQYYYEGRIDTLKIIHFAVVPTLLVFNLMKFSPALVSTGWFLVLTFIFYILNQNRNHFLSAPLLKAGIPYYVYFIVLSVVKFLFSNFYENNDDLFDLVNLGVIIWLFAYGISAKNQVKTIRKEQEEKAKITNENEVLETLIRERTNEILAQKNQLEETIEELKLTQNQLIQQEKLASLGELTAGIAHEIQNPLNFVNNFSEVSIELIEELKEDLHDVSENSSEIIEDLVQNLRKISHHGGRASGIVKSMLEHSRSNTGEKQAIDINALLDEYIRLSYHGLRAKDKSFVADFKIHADENLPQIEAIPQDIGRVFLNLCNNAFYAVHKKAQKTGPDSGYKPMVTITTNYMQGLEDNYIRIAVADNGTGIPEEVKTKIFQPFFTTKPTGEGTGLGLSLSYDIITKGHSGHLEVESTEGEGTTFTITLPANSL